MRTEHLQSWLAEATQEEQPDIASWEKVVDILQMVFRYGRLIVECTRQKLVIIPKGNGDFKEIGIMEVLWKALLGAINWRLGRR